MKWSKEQFVTESNAIEGYKGEAYGPGSKHYDNHIKAFDYCVKALKEGKTGILHIISSTHKILMQDLLLDDECGGWRQCNVWVGVYFAPECWLVPSYMDQFAKIAEKAKNGKDCWNCHYLFESIHPFVDGNGRIGRILLNAMRIKNGLKPVIVESELKEQYYADINKWRDANFDKILKVEK